MADEKSSIQAQDRLAHFSGFTQDDWVEWIKGLYRNEFVTPQIPGGRETLIDALIWTYDSFDQFPEEAKAARVRECFSRAVFNLLRSLTPTQHNIELIYIMLNLISKTTPTFALNMLKQRARRRTFGNLSYRSTNLHVFLMSILSCYEVDEEIVDLAKEHAYNSKAYSEILECADIVSEIKPQLSFQLLEKAVSYLPVDEITERRFATRLRPLFRKMRLPFIKEWWIDHRDSWKNLEEAAPRRRLLNLLTTYIFPWSRDTPPSISEEEVYLLAALLNLTINDVTSDDLVAVALVEVRNAQRKGEVRTTLKLLWTHLDPGRVGLGAWTIHYKDTDGRRIASTHFTKAPQHIAEASIDIALTEEAISDSFYHYQNDRNGTNGSSNTYGSKEELQAIQILQEIKEDHPQHTEPLTKDQARLKNSLPEIALGTLSNRAARRNSRRRKGKTNHEP